MHRNQKGFTLMELMVVIVIVAILAAVAVPLYINYVKDAQRTDAKAAIGAIITAEQSYYLKSTQDPTSPQPSYAGDLATLSANDVKLLDAGFVADIQKRWNIAITVTTTSYTITASSTTNDNLVVKYEYDQNNGGTWSEGTTHTP
jgi:prepilin-type N-terminal cleavage/methylation domain-containing protein